MRNERLTGGLEAPVLPLRDAVLMPHAVLPFSVERESSVRLLESLGPRESSVVLALQRDPQANEPGIVGLHPVGTIGRVLNLTKIARGPSSYVVVVEGLQRVRLVEGIAHEPFLRARLHIIEDVLPAAPTPEFAALQQNVRNLFSEVVAHSPTMSNDLIAVAANIQDSATLGDFVAATMPTLALPTRQALLETPNVEDRLTRLAEELVRERENQGLQEKIRSEIHDKVAGAQRQFFLREQLKAIQKELGEADDTGREMEELRAKIEAAKMPEEAHGVAVRELARLEQIPAVAAEYTVARTYIDWLVSLPWSVSSAESIDVRRAQQVLDEDHHDLEKVKERILEYLAVFQLKRDLRGPILCFVGPPGVGKTSLGKSIARALGRKFVRISLGGMHDEAEIRGHRRTYVGALPGQILQGLRRAQTFDPVFMLDEVDKLGRDFRGDPAAALLEVLDPEQNSTFRDHYLDVMFDLSRVLFITTANILDPVPPALLDRMEVLPLAGYSEEEKLAIALRYLVPRQVQNHALALGDQIRFEEAGLIEMIRGYTHEAGVRNLEREIARVCRKHARRIAAEGSRPLVVTPAVVGELLGVPRFRIETELEERVRKPGVAVGLAWTPQGGEVLFVEATRMPRDKGEFTITGQLGQVMQESTKAALSWLKSNAEAYGLDPEEFKRFDVHIHVPSGAVPKDGPSAGVVMAAALFSLFAQRPLPAHLAMTGEITLSGDVLPVGGIKEKVLAARRSGVHELLLPAKNEPNVREDVPPHLLEGIEVRYVRTIEEVLERAFGRLHPEAEPVEVHLH